jgi:hypothetical protein
MSLRPLALLALLVLAGCGRVPSGAGRKSQPALLVQRLGDTRLELRYNRPSLRHRPLFGGIVPWDSVWCPGADEGTRLETSAPLKLGGQVLPRGAYSLWLIPRQAAPWTLIFSRDADAFHVPYPGARHDALRVQVTPSPGPYQETLEFGFPAAIAGAAILELRWGEVRVQLPLEVAGDAHLIR